MDFTAANESLINTAKDIDGCHFQCYREIRCIAYAFNSQNRVCRLKLDSKTGENPCPQGSFCAEVEGINDLISSSHLKDSILKIQNSIYIKNIKAELNFQIRLLIPITNLKWLF